MTVAELIEKLREMPQDAQAVRFDHRGNFDVIGGPELQVAATYWPTRGKPEVGDVVLID